MAGSIRQEELLCGSCVATDMEKDPSDTIWGMDHGLVDGAGLVGMLIGHLEGIVGQLVEGVGTDLLIADIYFCVKAWKVNIDPVRIFRDGVEEAAIADNIRIDWEFEAKGVAGTVESLVFVPGEIDPEIAPAFWRIGAVTGLEEGKGQQHDIGKG